MIKHLLALTILLTPSCGNPPSTPSWSMPEAQPIYGKTVFEDDEITVVEVTGIEGDGDKPSHLILKNDID
ncbi:MAG TPA: hypothetical protein VI911_07540 [Patescibacteria group bacterium]|nr:hypothetical protein [Patescibacteria group bacterium]